MEPVRSVCKDGSPALLIKFPGVQAGHCGQKYNLWQTAEGLGCPGAGQVLSKHHSARRTWVLSPLPCPQSSSWSRSRRRSGWQAFPGNHGVRPPTRAVQASRLRQLSVLQHSSAPTSALPTPVGHGLCAGLHQEQSVGRQCKLHPVAPCAEPACVQGTLSSRTLPNCSLDSRLHLGVLPARGPSVWGHGRARNPRTRDGWPAPCLQRPGLPVSGASWAPWTPVSGRCCLASGGCVSAVHLLRSRAAGLPLLGVLPDRQHSGCRSMDSPQDCNTMAGLTPLRGR